MKRRTTIKLLTATGALVAAGGGAHWLAREPAGPALALDGVVRRLRALETDSLAAAVVAGDSSAWGAARTLNHL